MFEKVIMKKPICADVAKEILENISHKEAFYFFTGIGNFTGKVASSLADFRNQLKTIDIESVNFHYSRQDFEKWIKETLRDDEVAKQISIFKDVKGETLRSEILRKVENRLVELRNATTIHNGKL